MAAAMVSGGAALLLESAPIDDGPPGQGHVAADGVDHARRRHDRRGHRQRQSARRAKDGDAVALDAARQPADDDDRRPHGPLIRPRIRESGRQAGSGGRLRGLARVRRDRRATKPARPGVAQPPDEHRAGADHLGQTPRCGRPTSRSSGAINCSIPAASRSSGAIRSSTPRVSRSSGASELYNPAASRSSGATADDQIIWGNIDDQIIWGNTDAGGDPQ